MQPFEKLGAFYLGQEYDLKEGKRLDRLVMYDARDLTTHAVCVGMTGSGKTGLCIDLLEEAAIDSVPAIIIDPKGDVTNLLLTFPELRPGDFEPWVNVDDARRKDKTVPEYAQYIAETWRKGLADWGQGPERVRMLKDSAEFSIFTPGSDAGIPVSILSSLRAPALNWDQHQETLRDQVQGTVSALLGLVDIEADPLRSREHILLSSIFEHFWREGRDLDLAALITAVQSPPVRKLGVFDVDTFFPEKDRFGLAMALNGIIAAPGFATWLEGQPLDVASLLYSPEGKPRHSIFYIAHLSDAERMFFVTLLLEQIVTWVRQQSGTTSLRALLYFDEAFGFFPPVAEPSSKKPLLTLLKQARAFGLGVVLTTQNPVDIDYKGLSNAGTWFIGKLQTEQDKARVLDGLQSASAVAGGSLDRAGLGRAISALDSRVFLLHNVHEDQPVVFHTRWAMSYLRGPLTRPQVRQLMAGAGEGREDGAEAVTDRVAAQPAGRAAAPAATPASRAPEGYGHVPPSLPPDVPQVFLPVRLSANSALGALEKDQGQRLEVAESTLVYEARLLALGRVLFSDRKRGIEKKRDVGLLVSPGELGTVVRWQEAEATDLEVDELEQRPEQGALFGTVPSQLNTASEVKSMAGDLGEYLYRDQTLTLFHNPTLELYSEPGESERDFRVRVQQIVRERRDDDVDKLREKYGQKLARLEDRLAREKQQLVDDQLDHESRKREEMISAGESLVGLLGVFGRRSSRSLSTAATKRRLTAKAKAGIEESKSDVARAEERIEDMRQEMEQEAEEVRSNWSDVAVVIGTYPIRPTRKGVEVELVALAWAPHWEIGYTLASGHLTHDRVAAWK